MESNILYVLPFKLPSQKSLCSDMFIFLPLWRLNYVFHEISCVFPEMLSTVHHAGCMNNSMVNEVYSCQRNRFYEPSFDKEKYPNITRYYSIKSREELPLDYNE